MTDENVGDDAEDARLVRSVEISSCEVVVMGPDGLDDVPMVECYISSVALSDAHLDSPPSELLASYLLVPEVAREVADQLRRAADDPYDEAGSTR